MKDKKTDMLSTRHLRISTTDRMPWSVLALGLFLHALLIPSAHAAAPTFEASAFTMLQTSKGFLHDGPTFSPTFSEAYAEVTSGNAKWFGSATADNKGNLEVGVDKTIDSVLTGTSLAQSELKLDYTYESGAQYGAVEFTVQAGEILFPTRSDLNLPGRGLTGFLQINLNAYINGKETSRYFYFLKLNSTDTGFEIAPNSTSSGLLSIDLVLSGDRGVWGVKTKEFSDLLLLPELQKGEKLEIRYIMWASADNTNPDYLHGISAKFGDPLHLTEADSRAGFNLAPAAPVPLPGTFGLFASTLSGFWLLRRRANPSA